MGDWAEEKAREWGDSPCPHRTFVSDSYGAEYSQSKSECSSCLAALLREVDAAGKHETEAALKLRDEARAKMLVEVRRVVEEIADGEYCDQGRMAREILSRLEKLDSPRLSTPEEALKVMGQGQPLVKMREIK